MFLFFASALPTESGPVFPNQKPAQQYSLTFMGFSQGFPSLAAFHCSGVIQGHLRFLGPKELVSPASSGDAAGARRKRPRRSAVSSTPLHTPSYSSTSKKRPPLFSSCSAKSVSRPSKRAKSVFKFNRCFLYSKSASSFRYISFSQNIPTEITPCPWGNCSARCCGGYALLSRIPGIRKWPV